MHTEEILPTHATNAEFLRAVSTAREHIPVKKHVRIESAWDNFIIVLDAGRYRVFDAGAWTKPISAPLLPWTPPTGEKIAEVDLEGTVRFLESSR